ncbi:hypothetical protein A5674_19575 [Mycobacterium malmoense]|uniref:TetR/AcrR family transcriptional regulator n=1 Tax=Mycobacterium malmoense TaxID=1780 RepID=UPI00080B542C|nr:TetR/AcrR family transcriptional regulator [Mycobacterium malmoense]OCB26383.1 hypothetical protein A5674_19575 [Mycobacterium malmoense]
MSRNARAEVVADAPSSVRNRPMQERSRALLERILASAGEAFDDDGVDRCSMEEVARRAGVSIGAVYRFFPNKAALVEGLAERYEQQHVSAVLPLFTPESLTRSADDIIGEFFRIFSSLVQDQPGWQGLSRAGYLFAKNPSTHKEWTATLERFLGQQIPTLQPKARRRAANMFAALSGWLILNAIESASSTEEGLREAMTVMVGYVHELRRRNLD